MAIDLAAALRNTSLFAGLDGEVIARLAQVGRAVQLAKGAVLFSQADASETVYVVRRGSLALVLQAVDGRELVIGEMRPGDVFGELAVLTGQPRSSSALAREAAEVIAIPGAEFLAALDAEPQLARRLQLSSERESALAFLDAPARLARALLQLDRRESAGYMTISQEELARHTGLTRQTTAKILGQWRRAGWLLTGRGKIVLLDRAALRRCVA